MKGLPVPDWFVMVYILKEGCNSALGNWAVKERVCGIKENRSKIIGLKERRFDLKIGLDNAQWR